MLKKICRLLVLGLMVCAGSACVTPTHASSAPSLQDVGRDVILTHVYPASPDGAVHELVALYNNTDAPIDITDWCVVNKNDHPLVCFNDDAYYIEPQERVVIVSEEYATFLPPDEERVYDHVFTVANKTSGSLVGSNDVVRIKDAVGGVVDEWGWSTTATKGYGYIRDNYSLDTHTYEDGSVLKPALIELIFGGGVYSEQRDDEGGGGEEFPVLRLTEVLPDPVGADAGAEFIEVYNAGNITVNLDLYALRIRGGSTDKTYKFTQGIRVDPGEYYALTNADVRYSLNNTAGVVSLLDGSLEIDGVEYSQPLTGQSWALFHHDVPIWQYTAAPTPGRENMWGVIPPLVVAATTQKPCNKDQFRNPATGRCKKVETAKGSTPCKAGQYRSAETGRCRTAAVAKPPAPCKVNQERNPETNRCRNIKKMTDASHGVGAVKAREVPGGIAWYAWLAVAGVVIGVLVYAVWEWKAEIQAVWQKFRKQRHS